MTRQVDITAFNAKSLPSAPRKLHGFGVRDNETSGSDNSAVYDLGPSCC